MTDKLKGPQPDASRTGDALLQEDGGLERLPEPGAAAIAAARQETAALLVPPEAQAISPPFNPFVTQQPEKVSAPQIHSQIDATMMEEVRALQESMRSRNPGELIEIRDSSTQDLERVTAKAELVLQLMESFVERNPRDQSHSRIPEVLEAQIRTRLMVYSDLTPEEQAALTTGSFLVDSLRSFFEAGGSESICFAPYVVPGAGELRSMIESPEVLDAFIHYLREKLKGQGESSLMSSHEGLQQAIQWQYERISRSREASGA